MNNTHFSSLWIQVKVLKQNAWDTSTCETENIHASGAMVNNVLRIPWHELLRSANVYIHNNILNPYC